MKNAFVAKTLPLEGEINQVDFFEELIDATTSLGIYREKIKDSKLHHSIFMPVLQQKEALSSTIMEGTQATLEDVLINQSSPSGNDKGIKEVTNYYSATLEGFKYLRNNDFSNEFFCTMHSILMDGNVRKPRTIGKYRTEQNCIRDRQRNIIYIPPKATDVQPLMDNLLEYINNPEDTLRPLVRTAIVHAQFETIHPFEDGNGRVGRILIPMYLYFQKQIDEPFLFLSEALERDKYKYDALLNDIRFNNAWGEWIKYFLTTVTAQCNKYISIITKINALYDRDLDKAKGLARSSNIVDVMEVLYKYPIISAKRIHQLTEIPVTTVNRYLELLVKNKILYVDTRKSRNRNYFYYDLLNILY